VYLLLHQKTSIIVATLQHREMLISTVCCAADAVTQSSN